MVAQAGGPYAAGNVHKAPPVLRTPQDKVQRADSELSMLAAPTIMDASLGTPKYTSVDGSLPRLPGLGLQDAQSQAWTAYTPSVNPEEIPAGQPLPKHGEITPEATKPEPTKKPKSSTTSSGAKFDKYYHQKLVQISYFIFCFEYCNLSLSESNLVVLNVDLS